jgi:hypothetical protein
MRVAGPAETLLGDLADQGGVGLRLRRHRYPGNLAKRVRHRLFQS